MHSGLTDLSLEFVSFVFYGVVTSLFAYGGLLSELSAYHQFIAGETGMAVWYLVLGAIALYAVVTVVRERMVPIARTAID